MNFDIIIIGAGPAGLSFAQSLAGSGLKLALVEKQKKTVLAKPAFDGRDIALTHLSCQTMKELGAWDSIPQDEISFIREARVINGNSPYALNFDSADASKDFLGYMVSNHLIRQSLYEAVEESGHVQWFEGAEVTALKTGDEEAEVTLSTGKTLTAKLVVAADSRFSETRRKMGIPAQMRDFGRTVVVARMKHEGSHENIAYECFHYDRTLAVLPLAGQQSSVVITLPSAETAGVMNQPEAEFNADITERFDNRLGTMELTGPRIAYPLVAVYADRFYANRYAVIGDAAVGMHPVTAHGFNFGLLSAHTLAKNILAAQRAGQDIAAMAVLADYSRHHRMASRPLYLATNALVHLYTRNSRPARLMRKALLIMGNALAPARKAIVRGLTKSTREKDAA